MTQLATHPCQLVCEWASTGEPRDGLPLFRCAGCRSEWVRSEVWTPARADGTVSAEVAAEAAHRATSGRAGDGAGSAGR